MVIEGAAMVMPAVLPPPFAKLKIPVSSPNATSRFRMLSMNSPRSNPSPESGTASGSSINTGFRELIMILPASPAMDSVRSWPLRIVTPSDSTIMSPELPALDSETNRASFNVTSPPATLTDPLVTKRVPSNEIFPDGLPPRKPNACGGEAVSTLLFGCRARKTPSLPRLIRSRDESVNAPSTSTFAFSPNKNPLGFIR